MLGQFWTASEGGNHPIRSWHWFRNSLISASCKKKSTLKELGGVSWVAEVRLQEGESLENALRRFKRKVQTEDIIKEVKKHSFYLKPGEKKRVKQALARKRNRKKIRRDYDWRAVLTLLKPWELKKA
jgi:small subunit ribosomal protein S21